VWAGDSRIQPDGLTYKVVQKMGGGGGRSDLCPTYTDSTGWTNLECGTNIGGRPMNLKTVGVSNYQANIYLDLETKWVRKLNVVLFEITTTAM